MDVLSDVLRVVRLSGAVFLTAEFSAPWSLSSPPATTLAPVLMPKAECFTIFHILAEGNCWVGLDDQPPVHLQAGDIILFPRGDAHVMCSERGARPTPIGKILSLAPGATSRLRHGGRGAVSRFVCGYLHCDQKFSPLFGSLPPLLHVRSRTPLASVVPVGGESQAVAQMPADATTWLETTVRYMIALAHSTDTGNSPLLVRLTELLFVEVLRRYMEQLPNDQPGWLTALKDGHVGKAIELLHAEPARPWTVHELARAVGASRSALADRFVALTGETPMRYLAGWRVQVAQQLLRENQLSMGEVAAKVGYESEAAFNRAFKRYVGTPPATWRKQQQRPTSAQVATAEPPAARAAHPNQ